MFCEAAILVATFPMLFRTPLVPYAYSFNVGVRWPGVYLGMQVNLDVSGYPTFTNVCIDHSDFSGRNCVVVTYAHRMRDYHFLRAYVYEVCLADNPYKCNYQQLTSKLLF